MDQSEFSSMRGRIPLSRRNFLQGAGIMAAAAGVSGMMA